MAIRILITTDNHVGYLENDPIRGDDSWKTFDEICRLAKHHDVDMMVQGGDLFHVSKPSKKSMFHVIQSLRAHTLGDRPCELELLSDPAAALRGGADSVNYEDPNLNVATPVFAISGNHDDATGDGLLLPLDVMAATGLVNFFGHYPLQDHITISPLVFQKGTTKLALYGLNNLRDERLQRLMRNGNVTFQRPRLSDPSDRFFSILCLHQNHARHSLTSFVPEDFLPSFLDLVIWGHEHECIPEPQHNPNAGFDVLQPGSSVATSLSEGEAAPKHVFLVEITGSNYEIIPIPLQTVRPFVMADVCLRDEKFVEGPSSRGDIAAFLVDTVHRLIREANEKLPEKEISDDNSEDNAEGNSSRPLPLVRLRVDHTGNYDMENPRRFSNRFVGSIANVNDILLYKKNPSHEELPVKKDISIDRSTKTSGDRSAVSIHTLLKQFLGDSDLYLVPEDGIYDITKRFILQDDKQLFSTFVDQTVTNASNKLMNIAIDDDDVQTADDAALKKSFAQLLNKLRRDGHRKPVDVSLDASEPSESLGPSEPPVPAPQKSTYKSTKRLAKRPAKRTAKSAEVVLSDDEEIPDSSNMRSRSVRGTKGQSALDDIINLGS